VKHILQADLSKRYGNLKGGVGDIKDHKFFKSFSWTDLLAKKAKPGYIPPLKYFIIKRITFYRGMDDTRHFSKYPDSETKSPPVKPADDPFNEW